MKKRILILLLGALVLLCLFGCDRADSNQEETTITTNESTVPDATTPEDATSANTPDESTKPDNNQNDTSTDAPIYERSPELDEAFSLIEQDVLENEKLSFEIGDEELHFELKNSGLYDDEVWVGSYFLIIVYCDYATAFDEEWYQNAIGLSSITFNEALYNYYELHGQFSDLQSMKFEGLYIMYESREEFLADYSVVKSFSDSRCVTKVSISYKYSLPKSHLIG